MYIKYNQIFIQLSAICLLHTYIGLLVQFRRYEKLTTFSDYINELTRN